MYNKKYISFIMAQNWCTWKVQVVQKCVVLRSTSIVVCVYWSGNLEYSISWTTYANVGTQIYILENKVAWQLWIFFLKLAQISKVLWFFNIWGRFVYHHWGCTFLYRTLSYPLVVVREGGDIGLAVYYFSPQSFIITFSYSLA